MHFGVGNRAISTVDVRIFKSFETQMLKKNLKIAI
jgi:hypothetical protein